MPSNCTLPGWLVWPVNHMAIKLLQQPRKPLAEPCSHWPARACAGALAKVTGLGGQPAGPGGGRLPWGWGADQVGAGSLSPCPLRLVAGRRRGGSLQPLETCSPGGRASLLQVGSAPLGRLLTQPDGSLTPGRGGPRTPPPAVGPQRFSPGKASWGGGERSGGPLAP